MNVFSLKKLDFPIFDELFLQNFTNAILHMQFYFYSYSHPKEFCTTLQKSLDTENFLRGRKFVKSLTLIPWVKKTYDFNHNFSLME